MSTNIKIPWEEESCVLIEHGTRVVQMVVFAHVDVEPLVPL